MNRLSIIAMLALALCLGSCVNTTSKQFTEMEAEMTAIENQINELTDCDDMQMQDSIMQDSLMKTRCDVMQMLNFSVMGLRSDLENMIQSAEIPDTEINQLDEMLTRIEATWSGKWAAFDCDHVVAGDEMETAGEEDEYQDYDVL